MPTAAAARCRCCCADQLLHVAKENVSNNVADVRAVHVGVGHQNDLAVTNFRRIEIFLRDAGAERGDQAANFFVRQHLVVARFFHVENFSLSAGWPGSGGRGLCFGGAACGFSFDQEKFAAVGIALGAVGEFAGSPPPSSAPLRRVRVAALRRLRGPGSVDGFVDDLFRDGGVLLEEPSEPLVDHGLHNASDIGI